MASSSGVKNRGNEDVYNFQIEEEDLEELTVGNEGEEEGVDDRWCLVGRFLTNRLIDFDKIQNILASLCQPGMGMFVKKLEDNRFLFQLIINGSPWTYDRMQLIIQSLPVGGDPNLLQLNDLDMWVQIHDVKLGCMTTSTRDYLRVRVTLDIRKPLRRRMKLTRDNGSWFWAHFKYERVPTFCFICGLIGHSERFCRHLFQQPIEQIVKPYGEFMRAVPQKSYKNIRARWLRNRGWQPEGVSGDNVPGQSSTHQPNMERNPSVDLADNHANQNMTNKEGNNGMDNLMMEGDQCEEDTGIMEGEEGWGGWDYGTRGAGPTDKWAFKKLFIGGPWCWGSPDIMKLLSWNFRGIGPPRSIQFLKQLVDQKRPRVLFLCETLSNKEKVGALSLKMGFEGCFVVEAQGRSGGLALMWKSEEEVVIDSFSMNYIDCFVHFEGYRKFQFTGFYGEPNRRLRENTWELLRTLHARYQEAWCIMDMHGHSFTWEKGRDTSAWMEARLDRAMVMNFTWLTIFSDAKLFNLEVSPSDHTPLFLDIMPHIQAAGKKQFRFDNHWTRFQECEEVIRQSWCNSGMTFLQHKIQFCGQNLQTWGTSIVDNFSARIKHCNKELRVFKGRRDSEGKKLYSDSKQMLFETLNQREIFWRQRSKQLWLKNGDQNSKFFHSKASSLRRNNNIVCLKDEMGTPKYWDTGLGELMLDYFSKIFTAEPGNCSEVLSCVSPRVTDDENAILIRPIEDQEVKDALFQMHPDKSPGPDGMNPKFFQKYWHIVGPDVIACVKDFFTNEGMPEGLNDTNIVLIPKKKKPDQMSELRPISLCNVVAKVITKVLANRLKGLLSRIISLNQSAFIPGRLITDNIMVSFEVLHYLKRKQIGKEAMLSRLGFCDKWVRLIYGSLCSVQYHIVSSGYTMGPILPSRGLRQGDPISPYLFLICAEGLSTLIQHYEERKFLHGCRVANGAPIVSHLLFADDSFLYCKATDREVSNVQRMLEVFANASGQRVNFEKSSVFFSTNTTIQMRQTICNRLSIREAEERSKYFGLPSSIGRNKMAAFSYVVDKVQKRIQTWDNKFLSRVESAVSRFWWKSSNSKGIHWLSWVKLTDHKVHGGMGFRDFRDFNLSLLAKQGWRLLSCEDTLATKVFKARYFASGNFLNATLGSNPSYVWRSILEAQDLVRAGARRLVGDGSRISILHEPWLLDVVNPYIETSSRSLQGQMVQALMQVDKLEWDNEVISDVLNDRDRELVWRIPLSSARRNDNWFWLQDSSMRNDIVWNSISPSSEEVIHTAQVNFLDWCNAQQLENDTLPGSNMVLSEKWCPPTFPSVKVNVDGALFNSNGRYGVGMVAMCHWCDVAGGQDSNRACYSHMRWRQLESRKH
uniref:Reverse transcriptase domain-containing protein n=1 Tax=Cannabis sativa TaxID=3483 RepID=A0A803NUS5_CANSA